MRSWHRVEPNARDADVEEGLENRIADPLWMLARQWQLGEVRGEDAASPIHARAVVESYPIATFENRAVPHPTPEPWSPDRLLEPRVEGERVIDGPSAIALAAEAGLRFLRRLDAAGLGSIRARADWRGHFGFAPIADDPNLPVRARQRLALLARRAIDGRRLARAQPAAVAALVSAVDATRVASVAALLDAWRTDEPGLVDQPPAGGDCWVDEALGYDVAVGVPTTEGDVTLAARRYPGGRLDWHAFRVEASEAGPATGASVPAPFTVERLPTPVTFRGQPAPRWWELEDRSVYLGGLAAGPADVARLIVAEFATTFSDDWFVIPIELAGGSLNRVTSLEIIDVFGERHSIPSIAAADHAAYGSKRPWAFFELAGDRSAEEGRAPWLFLPPVLASSLDGGALEHVSFVRDEAANLGWAIEGTIELATGAPMHRRQQWREVTGEADGVEPADATAGTEVTSTADADEAPWRYRLQAAVPPWWIPLVPERTGTGAEVRLRRGRMQAWEEIDPALAGAKGRVIGVARALRLREEEVPRGGVQVTRRWQLARGADGRVHLWMARQKRPGRGDRGSGLRFDELER